jgi:hypothetical protein
MTTETPDRVSLWRRNTVHSLTGKFDPVLTSLYLTRCGVGVAESEIRYTHQGAAITCKRCLQALERIREARDGSD